MHNPTIFYDPTIFYALDYRSVSTFHRQSRYGAKNLFFYAVEAVGCVESLKVKDILIKKYVLFRNQTPGIFDWTLDTVHKLIKLLQHNKYE